MAGEWPQQALEAVAELSGGFAFKSEDYSSEGRFVLRTLNIKDDGSIHRDDAVFLPLEKCDLYKRFELQEHDTLFVMVGATLGKVGYVRRETLPALLNQNMWRIRGRDGLCDKRYLQYAFRHTVAKNLGWASGSARDFVRRDDYRTMEIPVPPLAEQKAIAAVLGALDDKIELNRRMNRTLEKMVAAIFKSWFIDFDPVHAKAACGNGRDTSLPTELPGVADLFPDSFEDSEFGAIPTGWTVAPMKDLADVNARSIKKDYPRARIRYVDISSVSQGSLDQTTTYDLADAPSRAKRLVQTGDTIWSCVRPNRKAYLYIDRPADNLVVSTGFAVLSPRAVPASYLHQWVTTQAFVDYLTAYATGAAYPAVKADTFETAKMLLPDKGILNAFHEFVGPLRARIAHNQRQNRRLAGLRDTLLPKLLSGEIELPAAEAVAEGVGI